MRDPVLVEILKNRFQAAAEEMASIVLRTGHTVFVKESGDFGTALVSGDGEVFACPINTGVARMVGKPFKEAVRRTWEIGFEEGDVFVSNDHVSTGGMATHLPDIHLWKPIFYKGEFICFSFGFIHSSDVGGRVPGSISPSSSDIFQEGFIVPISKLYRRDVLNEDLLTLMLSNCRIPDQNWGDIKALMTGANSVESRMHRLLDVYGSAVIRDGIGQVLDYAEMQARDIIRTFPDGEYFFHDYIEGDVVPGEGPILIKLRLVIDGDEILLDYTGTDPDVRSALNIPTNSTDGHWQASVGLINFLRSSRPEIPFNDGLIRPFKLHAPEGTVLNPPKRSAVGVRAATSFRCFDCVMGALAQAMPDRIPSAGSGQASMSMVSVPDPNNIGETLVSVVQPLCGGSGGRPTKDGVDGVDSSVSFLRNIPVESIESDVPILVTRYGLREDSAGAGKWRGGVGIELGFRILGTQATVTARGMERYRFPPWGRDGGRPGTVGETILSDEGQPAREIGKIDVLTLTPNQEILIRTQGGGGFGSPFERSPDAVLLDVQNGIVSVEAAEREYGVVIRDGAVDPAATEETRSRLQTDSPAEAFAFGVEREAYEQLWSLTLREHVNGLLNNLHGPLRYTARTRFIDSLEAQHSSGDDITMERATAIFLQTLQGLGIDAARVPGLSERLAHAA